MDGRKYPTNRLRTCIRFCVTKAEYRFDGDSCGVFSAIHEQSPDINRGVVREDPMNQGAGDQGMMFGYACRETDNYMPLSLELSHKFLLELAVIRREGKVMTYLRPDSKSQVTIEYSEEGVPTRVDTIVVSTQHDDFAKPENNSVSSVESRQGMLAKIKDDVINILVPRVKAQLPERVQALFGDDIIYHVNPTGKFVIGGPHGDTGLTGRKIIVDTYGGKGAHGGGAFSAKTHLKLTDRPRMQPVILPKILLLQVFPMKFLFRFRMPLAWQNRSIFYVNTYGKSKVNMPDSEIAEIVDHDFRHAPKSN